METVEALVRRATYLSMYRGACIALGCNPSEATLNEMASLTRDSAEAVVACAAMANAGRYQRVFAALDYLRECRARDVVPAPPKASP